MPDASPAIVPVNPVEVPPLNCWDIVVFVFLTLTDTISPSFKLYALLFFNVFSICVVYIE